MSTPALTPPPPAPQPTDSKPTFNLRSFSFFGWFAVFVSELQALILWVTSTAAVVDSSAQSAMAASNTATSAAQAAQASAASAAIYAGAPRWQPGPVQAGDVRYSPITQSVYRARVAHMSAVDPSNDPGHWGVVFAGMPTVQTADAVVHAMPGVHYVLTSVGAVTVHLPDSPALGDTIAITAANGLTSNTVEVGGRSVEGVPGNMVLDIPDSAVRLQWLPQGSDTHTWRIV